MNDAGRVAAHLVRAVAARKQLRDYQVEAALWLRGHPRANLFATPGMGKTAIVLQSLTDNPDPTLVIAPKLVAQTTWVEEALAWRQFNCDLVNLPDKHLPRRIPRITTIHPDLIKWLVELWGDRWPYRNVVWDESTRLRGFRGKGHGTKRGLLLEHLVWHPDLPKGPIWRWINLSGTPAPNTYLSLWGPQWFVDKGLSLGKSYNAFKQRWFYRPAGGSNAWYAPVKPFDHAVPEMAERMRPTSRTLLAKDYFDLKEPIERTISFELPRAGMLAYERMRKHLKVQLSSGDISAANAGVKALKLRQISSGALYGTDDRDYHLIHTARLEVLRSIVEELDGTPLIVVYTFRHELDMIRKAFPIAVELREKGAKDRWNAGRLSMLLVHPASAGHGLNLQEGGNNMVFYSPMSDNELYSQVTERIGATRQVQSGLNREVYLHHIEAKVPIDAAARQVREDRITWLGALMEALK